MRALAIVVALLLARPADACKWEYVSMFRRYDEAGHVVRARVRAPGGRLALAVVATLKGKPPKQINVGRGRNGTSCSPRLRGTGIAFLDGDARFPDMPDAFLTDKDEVAALVAYAAAKTPAERARLLVEIALENGSLSARYAAGVALADDPQLLAAVTTEDRERMIARIGSIPVSSYLLVALARLGVEAKELKGIAVELATERQFEAIKDPAALAAIIEEAGTERSARALMAFERCERIHNKRLGDFRKAIYDGVEASHLDWQVLADACRGG